MRLTDTCRSPMFCIFATNLQMTKFRVGHQLPIGKDGGTDPGAKCHDHHHALTASASSQRHLCNPGCICIIEQAHRTARFMGQQVFAMDVNPALIHVGGRIHSALANDGRKCTPNGPGPCKMACNFSHHITHRIRGCGLRCGNAVTFRQHLPFLNVDRRALHTAPADINA